MTEKPLCLLTFSIPLVPYPMPRPRRSKSGVFYTPKEAKERTNELRGELLRLNGAKSPLSGPLWVELRFVRNRERDRRGDGDGDNYEKWVLDAGNKIIWADDRQIVSCHWLLDEDEEGRVELTVGVSET